MHMILWISQCNSSRAMGSIEYVVQCYFKNDSNNVFEIDFKMTSIIIKIDFAKTSQNDFKMISNMISAMN